jgi:hypothetical protein
MDCDGNEVIGTENDQWAYHEYVFDLLNCVGTGIYYGNSFAILAISVFLTTPKY